MTSQLKRIGVISAGWAFVALGIVGLFLPFLQGILFLLIGLAILSTEYVWAHHLLRKLKDRFPSIAAQMDRAKERAERVIKRKTPKAGEA